MLLEREDWFVEVRMRSTSWNIGLYLYIGLGTVMALLVWQIAIFLETMFNQLDATLHSM